MKSGMQDSMERIKDAWKNATVNNEEYRHEVEQYILMWLDNRIKNNPIKWVGKVASLKLGVKKIMEWPAILEIEDYSHTELLLDSLAECAVRGCHEPR